MVWGISMDLLILNVYGHGEIMHVKFYWGVVSYSTVISL